MQKDISYYYSIQPNGIAKMQKQCFYGNADKKNKKENSLENLNKGFKNSSQVSKQTKRKIRKATDFLAVNAKIKEYTDKKTGEKRKYRLSFITLTLSSKQIRSDNFIQKNIFQPFLQRLRDCYDLRNYVWRAEKQKNGNIHFHLITDIAVNYYTIRYVWNHFQAKRNYLKDYKEKFSKMSLKEYYKYSIEEIYKKIEKSNDQKIKNNLKQKINSKEFLNECRMKLELMQKQKFSQPNSVDVARLSTEKEIAKYISKYISKDEENENVTCKRWSCSQSLSNLAKNINENQVLISQLFDYSKDYTKRKVIEDEYFQFVVVKFRTFKDLVKEIWKDYYKEVLAKSKYTISRKSSWNFRYDKFQYLFELS